MNDRVNIFPSRFNLVLMKARIVAATRGLNLLKRKRDALDMKLRDLKAELAHTNEIINTVMQEAIFSIAKANFLGTDFKPASILPTDRADIFMRIKNNRVVGLNLPSFELITRPPASFPLTGLSHGGRQVEVIRERFQEAVKQLIALASLEFSVKVLEDGVRQNNMRINGLDYVLIPRFQNTVDYIKNELDEFEREDFYRLKRSQAKQRKAKEKFRETVRLKNLTREQLAALARGDGDEEPGQTSRRSTINSNTGTERYFDPEPFTDEAPPTGNIPKRDSTRRSVPLDPVPEEDETAAQAEDEAGTEADDEAEAEEAP